MQTGRDGKAENFIVKIRWGSTLYGLEGSRVVELMQLPALTLVPRQPRVVRGIFTFKGNIIPVLSMAALCGEAAETEPLCILFKARKRLYALSVEEVSEMELHGGSELALQSGFAPGSTLAIRRVLDGPQPVFVLDTDQMIETLEG